MDKIQEIQEYELTKERIINLEIIDNKGSFKPVKKVTQDIDIPSRGRDRNEIVKNASFSALKDKLKHYANNACRLSKDNEIIHIYNNSLLTVGYNEKEQVVVNCIHFGSRIQPNAKLVFNCVLSEEVFNNNYNRLVKLNNKIDKSFTQGKIRFDSYSETVLISQKNSDVYMKLNLSGDKKSKHSNPLKSITNPYNKYKHKPIKEKDYLNVLNDLDNLLKQIDELENNNKKDSKSLAENIVFKELSAQQNERDKLHELIESNPELETSTIIKFIENNKIS